MESAKRVLVSRRESRGQRAHCPATRFFTRGRALYGSGRSQRRADFHCRGHRSYLTRPEVFVEDGPPGEFCALPEGAGELNAVVFRGGRGFAMSPPPPPPPFGAELNPPPPPPAAGG